MYIFLIKCLFKSFFSFITLGCLSLHFWIDFFLIFPYKYTFFGWMYVLQIFSPSLWLTFHSFFFFFLHDILHVSMPFSQIFPPSPSPTESIRLFYTSVSLLLSRTPGYCYHLSKFHIYALVYCIYVFPSGLLHSE